MGKIFKKIFCAFSTLLMLVAPPGMRGVYASGNITLQITSSQFMEIDETNPNQINYYTDASKTTLAGSVYVKLTSSADFLTPVMSGTTAVYDTGKTEDTRVVVDLLPNSAANFRAPDTYSFGKNLLSLSGTQFGLNLTGGLTNVLSFDFEENNGPNPPVHGGGDMSEPAIYPIVAQFDVSGQSPIEVPTGEEGYIVIPDNWTSGRVSFKAKIFKRGDETIEPYTGQTSAGGTITEENLQIAGITNGNELNGTVTRNMDENFVMISRGFSDYGKLNIHVFGEPDSTSVISQIVTVVHKNLINIKADAPLAMSRSFGTVDVDQAIITKDEVKDVKIFFGNFETRLIASGPTVDKIIAVKGGKLAFINNPENNDGSATIVLPGLNVETTTPIEITILKKDSATITRKVNIVRTAIQLQHNYGDGDDTVYAGYIVNKNYLYNNQSHNDAIFNAYLQVVLYKDNAVAGYKQTKIEDEELVNGLTNGESGGLELYSPQQIAVYGKRSDDLVEGVNKVSVFLTNGPIDFSGDTLPSVEFGIGSGVTCEWEALS